MTSVGVIGLGLMGSKFADRISAAGFNVCGYDVAPGRGESLSGHLCTTLRELSDACSLLVLALFDTAQVEAVVGGPGGLLELSKGRSGVAIVCTSTCDPDRIAALAARCEAAGVDFLEFPVSGTTSQIDRGEGLGLAGGDKHAYERLAPVLDAMCPRHLFLGSAGAGNRAKLAINLVVGLNRAALAEGLAFGRQIGLDPNELLGLFQMSAASSGVMPVKGPAMVARSYDQPQSRVDQSLKDFGLIRELGLKYGQPLPFAEVYINMLQECVTHGEAQMDNAAIMESILRLNRAAS